MASLIVGLPTITITTGVAPQTATWTDDSIGDAQAISFVLNAATTAPGVQISVALTTQSTATFFPLLYPIDSSNPSTIQNATSSGVLTLWSVAYRQIKFTTTGLVTGAGGIPILGNKAIEV